MLVLCYRYRQLVESKQLVPTHLPVPEPMLAASRCASASTSAALLICSKDTQQTSVRFSKTTTIVRRAISTLMRGGSKIWALFYFISGSMFRIRTLLFLLHSLSILSLVLRFQICFLSILMLRLSPVAITASLISNVCCLHHPSFHANLPVMDITQLYATASGSIFFCLILFRIRRYIRSFLEAVTLQASQHLVHPQLICRHRFLGPWSRADVLAHLFYIGVNMFCIGFYVKSAHLASLRAASLSLVNLIPTFAGPHLSFLADTLGLSLATFRRVHRSFGVMSCFMLSFHVFSMLASRIPLPPHQA